MRIAVLGAGFINWGGGIDFLKNYIQALRLQACEIVLLIPVNEPSFKQSLRHPANFVKYLKKRVNGEALTAEEKAYSALESFTSEFPDLQYVLYDVRRLEKTLVSLKVDVVFPRNECVQAACIPSIGYIPDFQHKYLPEFFSKKELENRDKAFGRMLSCSKAVVTNSRDTKRDCKRFYPDCKARVYAMPFAPTPRDEWLDDRSELIEKYRINYPYLIICNQFWQHKDHLCAIDAFRMLSDKSGYENYRLLCTGAQSDYRAPSYVEGLKRIIKEVGLEDKIMLLGYLDKADQVELVKHADMVIQPSLFEGGPGGGSAYDAVSLGRPIVLSDINVNKEVDSDLAFFFKVGDPYALYRTIFQVLDSRREEMAREALMEQGLAYRRLLGSCLMDMLEAEIELQRS